jgi:hypothetical protein
MPSRRYDHEVIRRLTVVVCALLAASVYAGWSAPAGATPKGQHSHATAKNRVVKVISVSATLEPYNPQITNHGIEAEQVRFVVRSADLPLTCGIVIRRSGRVVGSTLAGIGPTTVTAGVVTESIPVDGLKGGSFAGSPANARVRCQSTPLGGNAPGVRGFLHTG